MNNSTSVTVPGVVVPDEWDALHDWLPLVYRLRGAGKSQGISVIQVNIIVDEFGVPQHWSEPNVRHIEPKGRKDKLIDLLAE